MKHVIYVFNDSYTLNAIKKEHSLVINKCFFDDIIKENISSILIKDKCHHIYCMIDHIDLAIRKYNCDTIYLYDMDKDDESLIYSLQWLGYNTEIIEVDFCRNKKSDGSILFETDIFKVYEEHGFYEVFLNKSGERLYISGDLNEVINYTINNYFSFKETS